jgi:threonine/homoserine/homoserine lactone efflux protein
MSIFVEQYLLFLSVVTLIVVTPDLNMFLLLGTAPGEGKWTGLIATLGVCAAILSHVTLALVGGVIIATSAVLFTAIKVLGSLYLVWMGVKSLLSIRSPSGLVVESKAKLVALSASKAFAPATPRTF